LFLEECDERDTVQHKEPCYGILHSGAWKVNINYNLTSMNYTRITRPRM